MRDSIISRLCMRPWYAPLARARTRTPAAPIKYWPWQALCVVPGECGGCGRCGLRRSRC